MPTEANIILEGSVAWFNKIALDTEPSDPVEGDVYLDDGTNTTSTNVGWRYYNGTSWDDLGGSGGGSGDVVGPGSSTDNAIARFDSTTGKLLQNTAQTTVSDNGAIATDLNADAIGLWIQQHSTQTANPFEIEDSAGNNQIVFLPDGGAIFNEEGNDVDFRVETDGNANALFVDGGSDNVGIGTGTPNASALLDLVSTAKGLGLPAMTEAERDAIGTPRDGLMIYNSDDDTVDLRANSAWVQFGTGGGSGGLYTSVAILLDVKATTVDGGSCSATTWNARPVNTEHYDPDNIVTIASDQFTPIAGDYQIDVSALSYKGGKHRLRLYNVTGTAVVQEGEGAIANAPYSDASAALLTCKFTANGTDAYRIDHYTNAAQASNGLGLNIGDGSSEIYMTITLRKLA